MEARKFWITALCLGVLTVCSGNHAWARDKKEPKGAELKAKMEAEGWSQISEGVFERRRSATKVEHLAYGREGFTWTVGELNRRLDVLREEYQNYPSEDLAKTIDNLSATLDRAKGEIRKLGKSTAVAEAVTGPACNICYSVSADASYLTSSQGVTAIADAKFNSDCNYSGNTYAQAYTRATANTTTTTVNQEDPKTGAAVTSHATATTNGSLDCYSSAYASVQSTSLGIYYDTSDNNSLCPPPPTPSMTVTMTGPSFAFFTTATCATKTWSASVSGGVSPYSYRWYYNDTQVGTGTSYSRSVCYNSAAFTIKVTVTDNTAQSSSVTRNVSVSYSPDTCGADCNCGGPGQPICP